ncbi:MAG: molybdopterin molybdotransferase MoeA [Steroidobacteraceae bacterium]|jgi:molybdopterin molybdotransferase|nr:molybdopterin molybdotransferase MoeA [Steroidobacteraceae bacterium]
MITPSEAEAAVRAHARLLPEYLAPLTELSGAVLRQPVAATADHPPYDRVTMDGVAFAMAAYERGRREFRIAGTQGAGAAPLTLTDPETCIEVMTGASLPVGCDCVIPVEKLSVRDGVVHLAPDANPSAMLNVHARGLDARKGQLLLEPGVRLGPPEIAVLASNGYTHVRVSRPPRIVVISTGDELVEPGKPLEPWQVYRSNAYGVLAALQRRGYARLSHDHLPDDPPALRTRLRDHLALNDALILSGGVSMGRFDYVPQILGELGVRMVFHRVSQRPGKPLWFGVGAQGQTVYALPGNPVSTLISLARYVFTGLEAALGLAPAAPRTAVLSEDLEVKPALTYFLPVKLAFERERCVAQPQPTRGSGDFTSLIGSDGFIELPPGPRIYPRGESAPFYSW